MEASFGEFVGGNGGFGLILYVERFTTCKLGGANKSKWHWIQYSPLLFSFTSRSVQLAHYKSMTRTREITTTRLMMIMIMKDDLDLFDDDD